MVFAPKSTNVSAMMAMNLRSVLIKYVKSAVPGMSATITEYATVVNVCASQVGLDAGVKCMNARQLKTVSE